MRGKFAVGAVAVGVALGTALLPGAASASTSPASTSATTSMTPAMAALVASSTPKTVVLNPATGAIISVTATGATAKPAISNHNICNTGDGCYYTDRVPYADQGFYGSAGTFHGSWPYRNAYDTGKYTAKACWTQACTQAYLGPNTYATFGGTDVTGTSFTIK
jgi:hypothetical protein